MHAEMPYYTVEDAFKAATDVVIAEYTGKRSVNAEFTEYLFSVKKRMLGNSGENIVVSAMHVSVSVYDEMGKFINHLSHYDEDVILEIGKDYLLPLVSRPSVYDKMVYYKMVCGLAIDLNMPSESCMYGKRGIESHMAGVTLQEVSISSYQSYIETLIQNNLVSKDIPVVNDLAALVYYSPNILLVEVGECTTVLSTPYQESEIYECRVIDVLKSNDTHINDRKEVKFFANTVKKGDTVIVFVDEGNFVCFPVKCDGVSCVQNIDKKDEIMALIASS